MNDYITLDGYKYRTPSKYWSVETDKPNNMRYLISGALDVSYGAATVMEWKGYISGPVTAPGTGFGTISDLRTSLAKKQSLSFTDHYGATYTVHVFGPFVEKSLSSKWDSPSNTIYVQVRIVKS